MSDENESLALPLLVPETSEGDCEHVLYKSKEGDGFVKVCVCGKATCTCNSSNQAVTPAMKKWNPTFTVPMHGLASSASGELAQQLLFHSSSVSAVKIDYRRKQVEVLAPHSSSSMHVKRSIASLLQSLGLLDESFYKSLPPATLVTSQFRVTGMTCSSCVASLESLIGKVPGINSVSVSLLNNSLQAVHDPEIASLDIIKDAIDEAG